MTDPFAALVDTLTAAVAARLGADHRAETPRKPVSRTVAEAVSAFLITAEKRVTAGRLTPRTAANYRTALAHLTRSFGDRPAASLAADELEQWADRDGWGASYQSTVLGVVRQALAAAGVTLAVRRPAKESRGADAVVSDGRFAAVLQAVRAGRAPGDLAELLQVLRATGARPQEVAGLEVAGVDWPNACARLRKHKTKRKTGKDRLLVFSSAAMAVLRRQRERHGSGLLFRNSAGRRWTPNAIVKRMIGVSKRLGYHVIAYGAGRHSFATNALAAGVPDAVVAELLGHKGTGMLHAHYSHLSARSQVLRDAAERVGRAAT